MSRKRKTYLDEMFAAGREEGDDPPAVAGASGTPPPRKAIGVVGVVGRSLAGLKSRAVVEIDPGLIDTGGIRDRLDDDPADIEALAASIGENGQQVPILVRPAPSDPKRYAIVYGRRRVAALRRLGRPVRAIVHDLDERAVVIAQGQENTARKNLTFVEKANFARQLLEAGHGRDVVRAALSVDDTELSRMRTVTGRVPVGLIEAIGPAPGVGRRGWLHLAELLRDRDAGDVAALAEGETSDDRFRAVLSRLAEGRRNPPISPPVMIEDGDRKIATVSRGRGGMTIKVRRTAGEGFDEWLAENLARLHRDWVAADGEGGE